VLFIKYINWVQLVGIQIYNLNITRIKNNTKKWETNCISKCRYFKFSQWVPWEFKIRHAGYEILSDISTCLHRQSKGIPAWPSKKSITILNPLALELDIYSLTHRLCKMLIFYEPRRVNIRKYTTFCGGMNADGERKSKKKKNNNNN